MELEPLRTYLDSFRYGTPPHGGLGAGLNRIVMVLLGLDSIPRVHLLVPWPAPAVPLDGGQQLAAAVQPIHF